jgi:tetratricopeptide (TPR) repeat protein
LEPPEKLAEEALKFLEIAQNFEKEKNIDEAISNYQRAADYLKHSGYLMHRIQEIYDRIGELKDFAQKETLYQQTQTKAHITQLQDQAFTLLEAAKKLEFDGLFENAIQQYLSAINLLVDAGWTESQLENLKNKIIMLKRESEQQKIDQPTQLQETPKMEEVPQITTEEKPQVVGMFGKKSSVEKAEVLEKFRKKKHYEENIQNEAFSHIDAAKMFEKDRKYDTAIKNYERAVELLDSIGWDIQTQKIQSIIQKLKRDKLDFEDHQIEVPVPLPSDIEQQKIKLEEEAELKKDGLIKYETQKRHEEEIQLKAFNLIDIASRLEREKRYDDAVDKLNQAVQLLRSIEWDSYIQPISNLIENVKNKQKREVISYQLKEKRQRDLQILQDSIYQKQKDHFIESAKELDKKRRAYEEKKKEDIKKEEDLFNILDKADDILKEKNFDEAIDIYHKALPILTDLGPGWEPYRSMVQNTISNVEKLKNSQLTKKYEDQKKLEERNKEELEFQRQLTIQINKERERLKKKEIVIKDREEEIKSFEKKKNKAFEFLDSAIDFLNKGDYDNTILNYQNAGNNFAEIQWTEEVPLIEESIRDVEELKRKQVISKQQELKANIKRQKEEEEFQKQISRYLQKEREQLKKKKIELMEREKELKFREERRKAGFKLLEESQIKVKEGNFDEAIEILQYAINFFADAQWQNEINLIQNAIVEIENKKRDKDLQAQIEFQAELEREKQEKAFQARIAKEMKAQHQNLIKREIYLREKEKELAFREGKKQEAFDLLQKAQDMLSQKKFDEALQVYYNVSNIFAQIQWTEEIPIIREAIFSIEDKKRQDGLNKQKLLQKSIKKEADDKTFIELIRYQTEREKIELLKEKDILEKQKQLSAQNLAKQQKAFSLIENGDKLLEKENFENATANYSKAIDLLKDIGWEERYLKLLTDTIQTIKIREKEKEIEEQQDFEISLKLQKEDDLFQKKITDYMLKEQKKLKEKRVEIQKREDLGKLMDKRKSEAFIIMDDAQNLLIQGEYDKSIEKYLNAELILNEINFPTSSVREMISKIQEKRREQDLNQLKELELRIRREQEDKLFQEQILKKIEFEQHKMREKQEKLKKQEDLRILQEQEKENAFKMLEEAQKQIEQGKYDETIELYHKAIELFKAIQWDEEIELIQNSINVVENKKRDAEIRKQQELQSSVEKEKQERVFQEKLIREMKSKSEELKRKEITLREREKEQVYREKKKDEAFDILEKAQNYISLGKFDKAIEMYNSVANIFAQIQWVEEIPIIMNAIKDIEEKKRESNLFKQKSIREAIEKEKANFTFIEKIRLLRESAKIKELEERERFQKKELLATQDQEKEKSAFNLIDSGFKLVQQENHDAALLNYQNALNLLTEIGWTSDYLKLLKDDIELITIRKREMESRIKYDNELKRQRVYEEEQFQKKIYDNMQREQERMRTKKIEVEKHEKLKELMENRKSEAFEILNIAENLFNQKKYDKAIDNYRQAELILHEIGFPTNSVREMIHKVQERIKEDLIDNQKKLEFNLQQAQEEYKFHQQIAKNIRINDIKLKAKQEEIEKQKQSHAYMEKRKEEAFDFLKEAEIFIKQIQYDKALEYYHAAELILSEIAFPTDSIRELILKVQEKKREQQLQKQKALQLSIQKEREEFFHQQQIAENLRLEQERLNQKEMKILEREQLKSKLEGRKEQAFKILDEGEKFLQDQNYDNAIVCYRRAGLILNELQFPTDSINNMIFKINKLKNQKVELENLEVQKDLEKLEEERTLAMLIEERRRQEREKKEAQKLVLQEREKIIQEQKSVRESAYSLLEEAGKYMKQHIPNYNEAVSLYIQARRILAENIGWEPEIENLNRLIKDLQQEQANFMEKRRLEEQARLQRENEYAMFQEEVKSRRLEQERLKREQERQYRNLVIKRQQVEKIRDDGLKLIDEGKKWAAYHDFERAYENFNSAITKFKAIGWDKEIKYIETEVKNTRKLEEKVIKEESRIRIIQDELEEQRSLEKKLREKKEEELKETIGEVSELADSVISLIEERRQQQMLTESEQTQKAKTKAREFRKEMTNLIKVKEELMNEIATKEEEKKQFQEKLEEAKEREKVDSLKKMIKEAAEKKKM